MRQGCTYWRTAALIGLLTSCTTEGPLLVRRDAGAVVQPAIDASVQPAVDAGVDSGRPALRADMSLQYQITGALDVEAEGELFVADLFATSAAQIAALHAQGRVVIAYVSVGSLERWRDDAAQVPADAVGEPLASYPDEAWLDIRSASVRTLIEARFERARSKGFDGVYASALGAYRSSSGFALTSDHQLDYLRFLVREAHERTLHFGLSGEFALASELAVDFAIAVGCVARQTCAELTPWLDRKVPTFDLETAGEQAEICSEAASYRIPVVFKRSSFDAYRSVCP